MGQKALNEDHRRLSEESYATNLKLYLGNELSFADVTVDDLDRQSNRYMFTKHSDACNLK